RGKPVDEPGEADLVDSVLAGRSEWKRAEAREHRAHPSARSRLDHRLAHVFVDTDNSVSGRPLRRVVSRLQVFEQARVRWHPAETLARDGARGGLVAREDRAER